MNRRGGYITAELLITNSNITKTMSTNIVEKYVQKFRNLRIDRAHGVAPNKPVLLLAILELIEQGQIRENIIPPSPSLFEIFMKYWSIVTDRRPNLALPFFHLKSEGFWHHHPNAGYETALRVTTQIKTFSRLREIIAHASLDGELFALLTIPHDREVLRRNSNAHPYLSPRARASN